jgi:hypothetical protein
MLDDERQPKTDWLKEKGWAAVPAEEPFGWYRSESISRAIREQGHRHCYAVCFDKAIDAIGDYHAYQLAATPDDLGKFSASNRLFPFAMLTEDADFLITGDSHTHYIVSGPREFVGQAIGSPFWTARLNFFEYATDPRVFKGRYGIDIGRKYFGFNGRIEPQPGDTVSTETLAQLSEFLSDLTALSLDAVQARGWVAVPVTFPMSEAEAEWLSAGLSSLGHKECVAISTGLETETVVRFNATAEDLHAFFQQVHSGRVLLFSELLDFVIVLEPQLFYVLCGTPEFVQRVIGLPIAEARKLFAEDAREMRHNTADESVIGRFRWAVEYYGVKT